MGATPDVGTTELLCVALKAGVECLLCTEIGECDDLGLVALGIDVGLTGAVTALAALLLKFQFVVDGALKVRIPDEAGRDVRMASAAHNASGISSRWRARLLLLSMQSNGRKNSKYKLDKYLFQQKNPNGPIIR